MNIEDLYTGAIKNSIDLESIASCAKDENIDVTNIFNKVSLLFAKRFMDGMIGYEDADYAMNCIWSLMINYTMENDLKLIEPTYQVYCAFDAGEYFHKNGDTKPIDNHTKPALREILDNA